jgi:hypothetical protein
MKTNIPLGNNRNAMLRRRNETNNNTQFVFDKADFIITQFRNNHLEKKNTQKMRNNTFIITLILVNFEPSCVFNRQVLKKIP